jgi:hypothetical protein
MQEMENAMHFQHITFINIKQELDSLTLRRPKVTMCKNK